MTNEPVPVTRHMVSNDQGRYKIKLSEKDPFVYLTNIPAVKKAPELDTNPTWRSGF